MKIKMLVPFSAPIQLARVIVIFLNQKITVRILALALNSNSQVECEKRATVATVGNLFEDFCGKNI